MSNEIITRGEFTKVEKAMSEAGFSIEKVKQEISFAIQLINKSSQLQKCSRESLQVAVLNISNIGLSLNPAAKEAYLIPRWNNTTKSMEAVLEPGYVGLVKLLTDAGSVKSMVCHLVYTNDSFEVDLANNSNPVKHRPELSREKRGEVAGCYALATLIDGTRQVEYMDISEINDIRGRSETYKAYLEGKIKSCTWLTDPGEMARKTVIKRIYKYLPRTERMDKIDEAIKQDNTDFGVSDAQVFYIENLLNNSTLEQRQRDAIEMEIPVMSGQRAGEVINMLQANQQETDKQAYKKLKNIPA
jgi:recombination protein RecT